MKSKKTNKQYFKWSYPNSPKENALISSSSKKTYIILDTSMVVNPSATNVNHPLPSSNTNNSNSGTLQMFPPVYFPFSLSLLQLCNLQKTICL